MSNFNRESMWLNGANATAKMREVRLNDDPADFGTHIAKGLDGEIVRKDFNLRGKKVSLVVKDFDRGSKGTEYNKGLAMTFYRNYGILKKLGIPTFTTYRISAESNKVLMSDLTEGGKFDVISTNATHESLDIRHGELIKSLQSLQDIYVLCEKNGILLRPSSTFIRFNKKHEFKDVLVCDFVSFENAAVHDPTFLHSRTASAFSMYVAQQQNILKSNRLSILDIASIVGLQAITE